MSDHYFANLIWQIADLLRGPYRPPQYECVMREVAVHRARSTFGNRRRRALNGFAYYWSHATVREGREHV